MFHREISNSVLQKKELPMASLKKNIDSYQKKQDAFALLRLLQMSEEDVQAGRVKPAKQVFQELRRSCCPCRH